MLKVFVIFTVVAVLCVGIGYFVLAVLNFFRRRKHALVFKNAVTAALATILLISLLALLFGEVEGAPVVAAVSAALLGLRLRFWNGVDGTNPH